MLEGHCVAGGGKNNHHPNKHRQPVFDKGAELRHGAWNQSPPAGRNANSCWANATALCKCKCASVSPHFFNRLGFLMPGGDKDDSTGPPATSP